MPLLFWQGEPISEFPDGLQILDKANEKQREASNSDGLIKQALRRNFSPNGILIIIMIDTIVVRESF